MDIYFLPGLGTDKRLFSRLPLEGLNVRWLEWPEHGPGCSLHDLALRMKEEVRPGPHILCGVSMGGMVAQELAALTQPVGVVLISSWTGPAEWPWTVHLGARLGVQRVITDGTLRAVWPVKQWLVGQGDKATDRLLFDMAATQGGARIRHGLGAIFRWKGSPWDGPLVRIHGDADRVTPLRFHVHHTVKGGNHSMVVHKPVEVGRALLASIEQLRSAGEWTST